MIKLISVWVTHWTCLPKASCSSPSCDGAFNTSSFSSKKASSSSSLLSPSLSSVTSSRCFPLVLLLIRPGSTNEPISFKRYLLYMWMVMWNAALTRRRSYTPPWPPGRLLFPQVSHRDARRLHRPARHYFSAISKHEGGTGQIKSQVGPPSIRNKVHIIMITSRLRKPWGPKSSFASSGLLTYSL